MIHFSVAAIAELMVVRGARGVELGIPAYVAQGALKEQLRGACRRAGVREVEVRMVEAPEIRVLRLLLEERWVEL